MGSQLGLTIADDAGRVGRIAIEDDAGATANVAK